ncbi:hypothetical protein WR25_10724 isoform C [Diploscapter pachys]|uniref:LIM zinc-binding domain-containing protein n=2 Tax=Diploscapter pachys TaxID=2018661 RepID=A0A2A2KYM4_9BILA|nr:hypothetical protein WR25_10724 isoform C [Diploscapter pachys]
MTDFNTTSFLTELDSFGQPPPQQKLITGDDRKQQFTHKLDKINIRKQQQMLLPSQNGMVRLAEVDPTHRIRKEIKNDEVQKWRDDVLHTTRPRNQYAGWHRESADSAKEYVKMISSTNSTASSPSATPIGAPVRQPIHCTINSDNTSDSDEGRNTDSSTSNLHSSPNKDVDVHPSINGILHDRKHSDYSSASSQKSSSPFEGSNRYDSSPYAEYSNLYGEEETIVNEKSGSSPIQTFNAMFRGGTTPTFVNGIGRDLPQQAQPQRRQGKSLAEIVKKDFRMTPEIRVPQEKSPQPKGKPPVFRPLSEERSKKVRWTEVEKESEKQEEKLEELRAKMRDELVFQPSQIIGNCSNCNRSIRERDERYAVGQDVYHPECFSCDVCNRQLETTNFFVDQGRLFCKQDYLFKMEKKVQSCKACGQPLEDMVLTALGHTYHPQCFKCAACRICLDGVPFALDNDNRPFCMPDYYEQFAPRCAGCKKPILPENVGGFFLFILFL